MIDEEMNPFRKGGTDIRWDVIERVMDAYRGDPTEPELEEMGSLSPEEREALKWEMDRQAANEREIMDMLTSEGINNIAQLGGKPGAA